MPVKKILPSIIEKIRKKTVMTLPDDPSKQGYSPDQIKRRMAAPIIDENESLVSEVNRIVDEVNSELDKNKAMSVFGSYAEANQSEVEDLSYAFIVTGSFEE